MKKKLVVQAQDICFTGSYCLLFVAIALLLGAPPWFLAVVIAYFAGLHYSTMGSPIFWHYWSDRPLPSVTDQAMLNKTITIPSQNEGG